MVDTRVDWLEHKLTQSLGIDHASFQHAFEKGRLLVDPDLVGTPFGPAVSSSTVSKLKNVLSNSNEQLKAQIKKVVLLEVDEDDEDENERTVERLNQIVDGMERAQLEIAFKLAVIQESAPTVAQMISKFLDGTTASTSGTSASSLISQHSNSLSQPTVLIFHSSLSESQSHTPEPVNTKGDTIQSEMIAEESKEPTTEERSEDSSITKLQQTILKVETDRENAAQLAEQQRLQQNRGGCVSRLFLTTDTLQKPADLIGWIESCSETDSDRPKQYRSVYFLKLRTRERVLWPDSAASRLECDTHMSEWIEYSTLCGDSLISLKRLVSDGYAHALNQQPLQSESAESESGGKSTHHELFANMNKLSTQLSNAIQQVYGDITLSQPKLPYSLSPENMSAACSDHRMLSACEMAVDSWSHTIHSAIAICQENIKVNAGAKRSPRKNESFPRKSLIHGYLTKEGPMGEINFWRTSHAMLSGLWEQISKPDSQAVLKCLELSIASKRHQSPKVLMQSSNPSSSFAPLLAKSNSSAVVTSGIALKIQGFSVQLKELLALHKESDDNVRFLSTLEHHFKVIETGDLTAIFDTIPSMINALKMVWIISRHYKSHERMSPLLELIAIEICEKVAAQVDIVHILKLTEPGTDSNPQVHLAGSQSRCQQLIRKGKAVLRQWSEHYHLQREEIFNSGTENRWEFDRKKLFEQSQYCSEICDNLLCIVEAIEQFQAFLGPRLKQVTKDGEEIDKLTAKVQDLKKPLEILPFKMFDKRYKNSWQQILKEFNEKVERIENRSKTLIDSSFQRLRSAEKAFDLLQDFKSIECRETIQQQMMKKFRDILIHFSKEIDLIHQLFVQNRHRPPIVKGYPPIAGAILWSRNLFLRIKQVIIRFQEAPDLCQSDDFARIREHYLSVAMELVGYQETLLKEWNCAVDELVDPLLREPIIASYITSDHQMLADYALNTGMINRQQWEKSHGGHSTTDSASGSSILNSSHPTVSYHSHPPPTITAQSQESSSQSNWNMRGRQRQLSSRLSQTIFATTIVRSFKPDRSTKNEGTIAAIPRNASCVRMSHFYNSRRKQFGSSKEFRNRQVEQVNADAHSVVDSLHQSYPPGVIALGSLPNGKQSMASSSPRIGQLLPANKSAKEIKKKLVLGFLMIRSINIGGSSTGARRRNSVNQGTYGGGSLVSSLNGSMDTLGNLHGSEAASGIGSIGGNVMGSVMNSSDARSLGMKVDSEELNKFFPKGGASFTFQKIANVEMKAVLDEKTGAGHLSPILNELLFHFKEGLIVLNSKEQIPVRNSYKLYQLIRQSIFDWMSHHHLCEIKLNGTGGTSSVKGTGQKGSGVDTRGSSGPPSSLVTWLVDSIEEWLLINQLITLKVNFAPELAEIIQESKYLHRLGMDITDSARKVYLQESKFDRYYDSLQQTLDRYSEVIKPLSYPERCSLRKCFKNLFRHIKPGLNHLNWNSLNIGNFISHTDKAIQDFQGILSRMRQSIEQIDAKITSIQRTPLLRPIKEYYLKIKIVQSMEEFLRGIEVYKAEQSEKMLADYESIVPLLKKIESIVAQTETGQSPVLTELYSHFEQRIYVALVGCITHSMQMLQMVLNMKHTVTPLVAYHRGTKVIRDSVPVNSDKPSNPVIKSQSSLADESDTLSDENNGGNHENKVRFNPTGIRTVCKPLIGISLHMNSPPEISVLPRIPDIHKSFSALLKSLIAVTERFARWQKHSCLVCTPVSPEESSEFETDFGFWNSSTKGSMIRPSKAPSSLLSKHASMRGMKSKLGKKSMLKSKGVSALKKRTSVDVKKVKLDEEACKLYTFYDDIKEDPSVRNAFHSVSQYIQVVFTRVQKLLNEWRKYENSYRLWDTRALLHIDRLRNPNGKRKQKSLHFFMDKIRVYKTLLVELDTDTTALSLYHNVHFLKIDGSNIVSEIKSKCLLWINKYCQILLDDSTALLLTCDRSMINFKKDLSQIKQVQTLEDLQFVLEVIKRIQDSSLRMSLEFSEIKQRFDFLIQEYVNVNNDHSDSINQSGLTQSGNAVSLSPETMRILTNLESNWEELLFQARKRDIELVRVKKQFSSVTVKMCEDFSKQSSEIKETWLSKGPNSGSKNDSNTVEQVLSILAEREQELAELAVEKARLVNAQTLFNIEPMQTFPEITWVEKEVLRCRELRTIYESFMAEKEGWNEMKWRELDVTYLEKGCDKVLDRLEGMSAVYRDLVLYEKITEAVWNFRNSVPLLTVLKTDALRNRHWEQLVTLALDGEEQAQDQQLDVNSSEFTVGSLLDLNLYRFREEIHEICNNAIQERKIEKKLSIVKQKWNKTSFPLNLYKGAVPIIGDTSEIQGDLEDDILNLQTLLNSRHVGVFRNEVGEWDKNLNLLTECIEVWLSVQTKWIYLENIFIGGSDDSGSDIRKQLKHAAKAFDLVNNEYKKVMQSLQSSNANLIKACIKQSNRLADLKRISGELDLCQRSLSEYLESKRNSFPRFYFISDDELLSMLGSSNDPRSVQAHMLKLFVNCKKLRFSKNLTSVVGMESSENECFDFCFGKKGEGSVDCSKGIKVEAWMNGVEHSMRATLKQQSKKAIFDYGRAASRVGWIDQNLGMIGILGAQVWWTWQVEHAFKQVASGRDRNAMKALVQVLTAQINELVREVRKRDLSKQMRKKINTLIIIDVHARDIVSSLIRDSILDKNDFQWESQLRFYWDKGTDDVSIEQCMGAFHYGYEFMGLNGRLVITPLTDVCIMTLTQALSFYMGGAPAGPAGTGKTETVKDLAKALALPCFVTNCGEGLDYKSMASIFSGLVQIGAWGCFDEFNRIEPEVLSVVSTQLRIIFDALRNGQKQFELNGRQVSVNATASVGFFVTMNPGYAGRAELPDNLKSLFRPVTMVVPDMEQICEIMLFSEGFSAARKLATKMCVLYKLSKEQLSKQHHYDFGLRALKSVLIMAGALKRSTADMSQSEEDESKSEEMVLMRALRDMNAPKFVYNDVPLFLNLINDLFPALDCPRVQHEVLKQSVVQEMANKGLRHGDSAVFEKQVDKCIQLYETMLTRHTCMVVGQTSGGKTTIIQTLAEAQKSAFHTTVKISRLNPKAQTVAELYGTLDPISREWTDGILSKIFRSLNEPLKGRQKEVRWLLFDGDVDALWIENMNSVMDDNKLLTLANGERMMLQSHVKLLVEVYDLQYASPATISRCGMVYVDSKDLRFMPYFERWVGLSALNIPPSADGSTMNLSFKKGREFAKFERDTLFECANHYFSRCIAYILEGIEDGSDSAVKTDDEGSQGIQKYLTDTDGGGRLKMIAPISELSLIRQCCAIYDAVSSEEISDDKDCIQAVFIFSLMWSIGASLVDSDQPKFDRFVKRLAGRAEGVSKSALPTDDTLFEHFFDLRQKQWVHWSQQVSDYVPPNPFRFSEVMVPTVDTVRNRFLLDSLVAQNHETVMFVGDSGTAKTLTVEHFLKESCAASSDGTPSQFSSLTINLSSRTSSLDVQKNLMDNIEKRGPVWMPPNGKEMLVFVDDIQMPTVDVYGTQQPIALLKFLIEFGQMYERDGDLNQMTVKNLNYVTAMPPNTGRIDPRFLSLFSVFNVPFPSQSSLFQIYDSIISQHCRRFSTDIRKGANILTEMTLDFYSEIVTKLPATPSKFHYIFNLRDLSRVYQGVCCQMTNPDSPLFQHSSDLLRLWRHECHRVFSDRLNNFEDLHLVNEQILPDVIRKHLSKLDNPQSDQSEEILMNPLLYGDFLTLHSIEHVPVYSDLGVRMVVDQDSESNEIIKRERVSQPYARIKAIFDESLIQYNDIHAADSMNLVLFEDACKHLTRIHRILKLERGHALLIGVGGSGRKSLTKLAASMAEYSVFEITLSRNYGASEFREDMKSLIKKMCEENKPCVFMLSDEQIIDDSFLESINNLLTNGMIPALFEEEEKPQLLDSVRDDFEKLYGSRLNPNKENLWSFLINHRCRNNLHIVLCMSPSGDTLRQRCRNFPALINECCIDWFFAWPKDALTAVATHALKGVCDAPAQNLDVPEPADAAAAMASMKRRRSSVSMGSTAMAMLRDSLAEGTEALIPAANFSAIVEHIVRVHMSVKDYSRRFEQEMRRVNHVTPKHYLDFLESYKKLLREKLEENSQRTQKLEGGLNQITKASENVSVLKAELLEKNTVVKEKSEECTRMIAEIKEKTEMANEKKVMAEAKNEELKRDSEIIKVEKAGAEAALEEALPALEMARKALENLKKEDIAEIKVLANPKESVKNVCLCVLNLKPNGTENPADGWSGARAMMGDANFLQKLKKYPRDLMTESMYKKVMKFINAKPKDKTQSLTMENLQRVSKAGAGMLQWVISMVRYFEVARDVAPRRKKVMEMEKRMLQSQRDLAKTKQELSDLEEELAQLNQSFKDKDEELKRLQKEAQVMAEYLQSASELIEGLSSEKTRWSHDRDQLSERKTMLIGDCLLGASFLSYSGAFSFEYRRKMLYEDWANDIRERTIPMNWPIKVEDILTTDVERSEWISEGLPNDELSVQNGILTTRGSRYPLCIDPQMQAIGWIKQREEMRNGAGKLTIRTFNDSDFTKILELSLQFGNPFIFEGVDEENMDPIIDPILNGNFTENTAGAATGHVQKQIQLGDNVLDFDENFKLYLISKISNLKYSPETAGKTLVINFCVTEQGLEEQLLDVVVGYERPDLQKQRQDLVQRISQNNITLANLENLLLKELTEATGNILENKVLIQTLQDAKSKSLTIAASLEEAQITRKELEQVASQYRPVAKRGSVLFFSMSGLNAISRMYEYSLSSYLQLFGKALEISAKDEDVSVRLQNITETLTKMVYDYTCTGIFERHKLMYSFQLSSMIRASLSSDELTRSRRSEINFFLRGNTALQNDFAVPKPEEDWLTPLMWKDLSLLPTVNSQVFGDLPSRVSQNLSEWKKWFDLEKPEDSSVIPGLTKLQELCLLRCFRPDRVYNAVRLYVVHEMDEDDYFVSPPTLDLAKILEQSSAMTPVVFVLSKGADPMSDLQKLAAHHGIIQQNKFKYLALGQGQAKLAESMLEAGLSRGHWVVLQNCHLMPSWLRRLEKIIHGLTARVQHSNSDATRQFRLWLTTDPTPDFPIGILQSALKVVTEAPDGLRLNIRSSYSRIDRNDSQLSRHPGLSVLTYVLAFFHAVVQERRKYGKLGWNVSYDFNDSDFDTCLKLLRLYLQKATDKNAGKVPWESLRYLIGKVMYGGRVTDSYDLRVIVTYLEEYMGPFVFDDFQQFFFSKVGDSLACFGLPPSEEALVKHINSIPLENSPEVFGLHSNAEIEYYTQAAQRMWSDLIALQPRTVGAAQGISREDFILSIADSIQSQVPLPFDLARVRADFEAMMTEDDFAFMAQKTLPPTTVVLLQEIERWNELVSTMARSLTDLKRALAGEIGMSAELDSLSNDLFNGLLPQAWRRKAPDTDKKLSSWMQHFQDRFAQYSRWISDKSEPKVIWLSGLHIPETYLAALVQSTCRRRRWPLDKSTLFTKVTHMTQEDQVTEPLKDGCYVRGLYLEGAAWDPASGMLCTQPPKKLVSELPIVQVIPMEASQALSARHNTFATPVYVTQKRRNAMGVGLVFESQLTSKQHQSHWTLNGTAVLLNVT